MKKYLFLILALLGLHLLLLSKLRFTAWPEMLLWPYLFLNGFMPYKDIAMAHTPLLTICLAIFYKLFGVGIIQLKVYTWILIVLTDLTLFWVAMRLYGRKVAIFTVFIYLFSQIIFDGNSLWFDLMLVPFGILLLFLIRKKEYFWAGSVFAVMFLIKQTAFWFMLPIAYNIYQNKKLLKNNIVRFFYGVFVVGLVFLVCISIFGGVVHFLKWAINFGIFLLPRSQGQIQIPGMRNLFLSIFPFSVLFLYAISNKIRIKEKWQLLLWVIAGMMGAYPRFEYFHFQPALPFLSIGVAIVFIKFSKTYLTRTFLILYSVGFLYLISAFFIRNLNEGIRFYEADVRSVSEYLSQQVVPGQKIFVINWWDNIYPLTQTLPATTPWIPQLSWYQELSGVQDDEVSDLAQNKPQYIVFNPYSGAGLGAYIPQKLYEYVISNYHLDKVIDGIQILAVN